MAGQNWKLADWISWFANYCKGKGLGAVIARLMFACAIYYIWQKRKLRYFREECKPAEGVIRAIVKSVRGRVGEFRGVKNKNQNLWL